MWYWILAVYVVVGLLAYVFVISKWSKPTWEKVWYAVWWPAVFLAWLGHKLYNNLKAGGNGE